MKKILNNIGAVSKQVIVGGVISVATLVVGIGLMNNFSSSGNSEGGFASNALERSGYSYDSSYSGASVDDILSARDYAQGTGREGSVSAITGTENLAFKNNPANVGGVNAGAVEGQEGSLTDDSQAYGGGELEGMGTSNKVDIAVSAEDEATAKAQRDAKIAKGQNLGQQARATLKTSKMADASGIKGIQTGSTSMTYGAIGAQGSAGGAKGTADSSKVSLPNANFNTKDLKAASGKLGAMGNGSREADGKKIGRATNGQTYQALGDLGRASKYSRSGKEAVSFDSAQGAADAAAAFDGSKEAEAVSLEGGNLQQAALNNLQDMGAPNMQLDFDKIRTDLEEIDANMEKWSRLMDQYAMCIQSMILIASVAGVALFIASKLPMPVGAFVWLATLIIATAGLLAAAIASNVFLGQIADLAKETGYTEAPQGWDWAAPWVIFGGAFAVMLSSGFVPLGSSLAPYFFGLLGSLGGGNIISSITKMIQLGKNIKASKEAEAVANEINNQVNNGGNGGN